MDSNEQEPQWGRQQMTAAEELLRQMATASGGRIERDAIGRLVLVHDNPLPRASSR